MPLTVMPEFRLTGPTPDDDEFAALRYLGLVTCKDAVIEIVCSAPMAG